MFEYDEISRHAAETLDRYDFSEDVKTARERKMDYSDLIPFLSRSSDEARLAFDDLTEDEAMEYLSLRYGLRFGEYISYYCY